MDLRKLQELMAEIYLDRDSRRGADKTLLWMISEAGEVADAYLKSDLRVLESEVADLLAWLLSFCNVVGIDLEGAILAKYGLGCPNCGSKPCKCPPK
ncbi:MAG: nucleotide pyrophosphohydrolase [Nitrososphaeria archaeon]|nr:nucleotide pyrophosphohydrolase [Aigarchaeota archaeon]MCX8187662.1 nucleotide pyrophosphohydrolase [Nitrososphaeria archaeon]MDW8021557.1 MazG nucleotide pyrophosphohydrolase domain-containing protein [Nitrososphaerota archaeon]